MSHHLRLFSAVAVCLISASCATTPDKPETNWVDYGPTPEKPFVVKIMAINDLHGHLEGPAGSLTVDGQKVKAGGAQYLASRVADLRKEYPKALFVAAGDMVGASPMLSSAFHDEPTVEALNKMKLDVTAVGNHEFDEGVEELLRLKNGGCHPEDGCQGKEAYAGANYEILAANVVKKGSESQDEGEDSASPILPPVTIKVVDGVPIGFIGLTLKGTPKVVSPKHTEGYQFLDEAETINRYVKELQAKGVEAIVVLIHEGGAPATENYNGCDGVSGPIVEIVKKLDPAVDLVVSGHTHQAYICQFNHILTTSAKSYGRLLTEIDLTVDPKTRDVVDRRAVNTPIIVEEGSATDPDIDAIIAKYKLIVEPLENRVIGKIRSDITRQLDKNGESALGRLIADAQLAAAKPEGAQIAFMNPGGIRSDLMFKASETETRKDGIVTYGQMFAVQPFANSLITMTLTGEQIKKILEQQFENHKMLSTSKGFSYTYTTDAKPGEHVSAMKLNGKPIVPEKTYRVVANNFLAEGGDEFPTFAEGTDRIVGMMDIDAFTLYVGKQRPVKVPKDRRLRKK